MTASEIQFLGHFLEHAVMPGTLIVEAIRQSASILFSKTTGTGTQPGEFLVLDSINEMRFLVPVVPGNTMEIEVQVLKFIEDFALVEALATVHGTAVAKGKLGFARRGLQNDPPGKGALGDDFRTLTTFVVPEFRAYHERLQSTVGFLRRDLKHRPASALSTTCSPGPSMFVSQIFPAQSN